MSRGLVRPLQGRKEERTPLTQGALPLVATLGCVVEPLQGRPFSVQHLSARFGTIEVYWETAVKRPCVTTKMVVETPGVCPG